MKVSVKFLLLLLFLDILTLGVVFRVAMLVRGIQIDNALLPLALSAPILFTIFTLSLIDGYKPQTDTLGLDYASQHCIAMLTAMLGTLVLTYVVFTSSFPLQSSRLVIMGSFVAIAPLTLGYRRFIKLRHASRHWGRSIIFIGDQEGWASFVAECEHHQVKSPLIFCKVSPTREDLNAAVDFLPPQTVIDDITAGRQEVEAIVLQNERQQLAGREEDSLVRLYFAGIPTFSLELFHQTYWRKFPLHRLSTSWIFREGFRIAREPVFRQAKRFMDISVSGLGLVVTSPLIALAALAIWIEDRGPVFFRQTRIGKNDQPFSIYKLRTMRQGTSGTGSLYTQKRDARVTRVGRFLRASRIDEFPQLWNVLVGDMSIIGPRAEWDRLAVGYEQEIPCYRFRHLVKPGITGWAQVNYPYGACLEDTRRKLEYDLYYIRHYSFLLDASIVLKTIHVMLFGKGT